MGARNSRLRPRDRPTHGGGGSGQSGGQQARDDDDDKDADGGNAVDAGENTDNDRHGQVSRRTSSSSSVTTWNTAVGWQTGNRNGPKPAV